jgi:hypothetical protein
MPLVGGYLGDRSRRIEASAEQKSPAACQCNVDPGAGPAVRRLESRAQAALSQRGDGHGPRSHRQPGGVHARWRRKTRRVDHPGRAYLVPGTPPGGLGVAGSLGGQPAGGTPLDNQFGAGQRNGRISQQAPAQCCGDRERRTGHNKEISPRQRDCPHVGFDNPDVRLAAKPAPQPRSELRIPFNRDHTSAGGSQPSGNRAAPRAEVQNQSPGTGAAGSSQLADQPTVTQKVSTGRIRRQRPPCHGRP